MKVLFKIMVVVGLLYGALCLLLFLSQERLIFHPEKLDRTYVYEAGKEVTVSASDGVLLNGLIFKANSSKGLIFYLHGNAGSLRTWSRVAQFYVDQGYDVFMMDYRGYGKSEGKISSQEQFYADVQAAYDQMKKLYSEDLITVLGYSIGTGPAAYLASTNRPQRLILEAPYFSLTDLMDQQFPFVPEVLLKYKFPTSKFLPRCKAPVIVFHGDLDKIIYYGSSLALKELMAPKDTLITLHGQGHIGISDNPEYRAAIMHFLN